MKTDLEKFVELYESLGIELKPEHFDGEYNEHYKVRPYSYIVMDERNGFGGYGGFSSTVMFDEHGKFTSQGFYEG